MVIEVNHIISRGESYLGVRTLNKNQQMGPGYIRIYGKGGQCIGLGKPILFQDQGFCRGGI